MILQVVTDTERRGAQIFASDLAESLSRRGIGVRTVALAPGTSESPLPIPSLGVSRLSFATLRSLRAEMATSNVVVAHGSSTLIACSVAGAGLGVPFVYRQISDSLFWAPTRFRKMRVRAGLRRATKVVALWDGAASVLEARFGVDPRKVSVVPNGVPSARFRPGSSEEISSARRSLGLEDPKPVVLYVGALVEEKGVDQLVQAMRFLPKATLLVVGDGPSRGQLEELAKNLPPGQVRFTGVLNSPVDAYWAADVIVLPSRGGDSMPAVLIEAGLCELPAVATSVQAIPEIVIPGLTGELVSGFDVRDLAEAIQSVVRRKASYGQAARRHCLERFEIDVVGGMWLEVIRDIVSDLRV